MTAVEKEITKAAHKHYPHNSGMPIGSGGRSLYEHKAESFIAGAKSSEAQKYWQQRMYSEASVRTMCGDAWIQAILKVTSSEKELGFQEWFEEYKNKQQ